MEPGGLWDRITSYNVCYTKLLRARLVRAAAAADYLIVTEKDAVKLRHQWPVAAREPLVALLTVQWERGGDVMRALLDEQLSRARRSAEES